MPETTTTTKAWRADSVEGRTVGTAAGPAARTGPPCEGHSVEPEASEAGMSRLRRLGAAVARDGRAAWSWTFDRRFHRFEETLHSFAAELAATRDPDTIEAALLRLARRIATSARFELIRATGEPAGCDARGGVASAGRDGRRPDDHFEEIPLRCGYANHGVLRLCAAAGDRPATRRETQRRLTIACALAACALENARHRMEWGWDRERSEDGERKTSAAADAGTSSRTPCKRPDVVRDATFLNAVLPFALAQARRHGEPVSLVCVQVDRLGAIRDLLGSGIADGLVYDLAETAASLVRSSDIVARLDDDRVIALLVRARGDGAMGVARMIGRAVDESGLGSSPFPGISVSIGVAEFPAIARDAASLLEAADEAMSMARAEGDRSPRLARLPSTHASAASMAESPMMASVGG